MRIAELRASNFKRLSAVEICLEPGGGLVLITGKNDQGKTSILDAIWAALGGKRAVPADPVRHGTSRAAVELVLEGRAAEGGEPEQFVVTRTFTRAGGTKLVVTSGTGREYESPQALLDSFLGALTFDPLAFANMKPAEQRQMLLDTLGLEKEVEESYAKEADLKAERTDVNRQHKRKQAEWQGIEVPPDTPAKPVDTALLAQEHEILTGRWAKYEGAMDAAERMRKDTEQASDRLQAAREAVRRAESQLLRVKDLRDEILAAIPEKPVDEPKQIVQQIQAAGEVNAAVQNRKRQEALKAEADQLADVAAGLSQRIDECKMRRVEMLAKAHMPVPGMGISEDAIMFEGTRFDQLGTGRALQISVAIAMALNPRLKVLRVDHGEALDREALAELSAVAQEGGYDIWISKVDDSGEVGIVIEDGAVANPPGEEGTSKLMEAAEGLNGRRAEAETQDMPVVEPAERQNVRRDPRATESPSYSATKEETTDEMLLQEGMGYPPEPADDEYPEEEE